MVELWRWRRSALVTRNGGNGGLQGLTTRDSWWRIDGELIKNSDVE